jgi:KUP system potassium uptake protein
VYWFVHINRTNEPFTLSYNVVELVDDKVIKININVGFRIQPKVELYFKRIVKHLKERKELNLQYTSDNASKYNNEPDLKFVVIEKFISVENEFAISEGILLDLYFFLKRFSISDTKAFGLDKSDVQVEYIPLVFHRIEKLDLERDVEKCRIKKYKR